MTGAGPDRDVRVVPVVPLTRVRSLGDRVFDYRVPGSVPTPGRGALVTVPFGGRTVRGVVVGEAVTSQLPPERLADLAHVDEVLVHPELLALAEHVSDRYLAPLGAALLAVLPPHLTATGRTAAEVEVTWARRREGEPAEGRLTEKQERLLAALPSEGLPLAELLREAEVSRSVFDALVRKGLMEIDIRRRATGFPPSHLSALSAAPSLTDEQETALKELAQARARGGYQRRLLWGVTGSGKTEVYLRLLADVLEKGQGAIVLVPEIALTLQAANRLSARLGGRLALLHSALPAGRRAEEYRRLERGEARVALGPRSAVFAPVENLALIIVDESHDPSYKQEEEPRYDAREVAAWRAASAGALLLEGTATPRLESLGPEREVLYLRERPEGGSLPEVEVVDLRRQAARHLLAPRSRAALQETLRRGEQAVLLLNRRGYATYLHCEACGQAVMCPRCEISLTFYRADRLLRCHHCGYSSPVPAVCPSCRSAALTRGSPGTERLGEELQEFLPAERIFRLDSDVVTSASRLDELLTRFSTTSPAILVGTQMVAKGHDYPGVTLVVVADSDTGLYFPDFRAAERTFHLLVQVSGRAGRGRRAGRVLLQTWNPEVPCIRMAVARDEDSFYREELEIRRQLGYPPHRELVRLVLSSKSEGRARGAAEHLAGRLAPHLGEAHILGPARLPTIRSRERWHILLSAQDGARLRALLRRAVGSLREPYSRRGVDLQVDVDPQSFL